ncbi:MAG: hypothetical protein ACI805_001308, partial [Candidatus Azotimanducaceae bacterium]
LKLCPQALMASNFFWIEISHKLAYCQGVPNRDIFVAESRHFP